MDVTRGVVCDGKAMLERQKDNDIFKRTPCDSLSVMYGNRTRLFQYETLHVGLTQGTCTEIPSRRESVSRKCDRP